MFDMERATNGVTMVIATVALWGGILLFEKFMVKMTARILAEKRVAITLLYKASSLKKL
jgi:hypothetical protein